MALNFPKTITLGDRLIILSDGLMGQDPITGAWVVYTPATYTLSFSIRGTSSLDVTAAQEGTQFKTVVDTSTLSEGAAFWQAYISREGHRITIASGQSTLLPDLANQQTPFDGRTTAEFILEKVEAYMRGDATVAKYKIGQRELQRHDLGELMKLRSQLKVEIARSQGRGRRLLSRF